MDIDGGQTLYELTDEEKKSAKELFKSYLKGIEVGKIAYIRQEVPILEICSVCGGKGTIKTTYSGSVMKLDCPYCDENGKSEIGKKFIGVKDRVVSVYMSITNTHPKRIYGDTKLGFVEPKVYFENNWGEVPLSLVYLTEEEAIKGERK